MQRRNNFFFSYDNIRLGGIKSEMKFLGYGKSYFFEDRFVCRIRQ